MHIITARSVRGAVVLSPRAGCACGGYADGVRGRVSRQSSRKNKKVKKKIEKPIDK